VVGLGSVPRPRDAFRDYDAILANPGGQPGRAALLRDISDGQDGIDRKVTVALSARGDWGPEELALLKDYAGWLFFSKPEVIETAARAGLDGQAPDPEKAGRHLKALLGHAKLVATLGADGAYLLNGAAEPLYAPARQIMGGLAVGAGDTEHRH
jgi:hypothetical protein